MDTNAHTEVDEASGCLERRFSCRTRTGVGVFLWVLQRQQMTTRGQGPGRQLRVSPADTLLCVRDTMRISVIEGSFTSIFFTWTGGSILIGYMLFLGATPLELAVVASIPLLAQMMGLVGAIVAMRIGSRKGFMAAVTTVGRGIWILGALIPFMPIEAVYKPIVLLGIVGISSIFQSCAGPPWISLMGDIVPEPIRGRYFGFRNGVINVVTMIATIAAGWYMDHAEKPYGFQILIVLSVVCAVIGIRLYLMHHEPRTPRTATSIRATILVPLQDATFRRFLYFALYWNAAVMLAAPFVIPYFFKHLRLTFTEVAIWSAIASISSLVMSPLWGRAADRVGHKTVLVITTFLAGSIHPLCWILATPGNMFFVYLSGLVDALSWGGIHAAMFNLTVATAPKERRMAYVAVLGMLTGLVGCVMGTLSGPILNLLTPYTLQLGAYTWTGYHSLFLISGLLRTQAWRLLKPVHEPAAWRTRDVFKAVFQRGWEWLT
jgi:MFS family permease